MEFLHTWPVTTDGSDSKGRMTLPYLCLLMQETATLHADSLGWGYDILKENNLQWVLSRQWIRMTRLPRWKEEVRVGTWPSDRGAITWNRDFRIYDAAGEAIGEATSLWFVMDRTSRRPKPAPFGREISLEDVERVNTEVLKPLPAPENPETTRTVSAAYHDIDVHNHVNNVKYLTWMIDGLDPQLMETHQVMETEINFLAEGLLGDVLDIGVARGTDEGATAFLQSLTRRSDGAELCRMRSIWRPDESPA